MKIIISGASGDLGKKVTHFLLEHISAASLILLTRNPTALDAESSSGLMVRHADFSHPESLPGAFQGGDILLLISTPSAGNRVEQHQNAIHAAHVAGIKHIVYTSCCGIQPQNPSLICQQHYATEQALRDSGLTFTLLRNSWYADVIPQYLIPTMLRSGSFIASMGAGVIAPVAKDDCARVAATVLADPEHHAQATYEVTGPELLTCADIARICSIATGRNLDYRDDTSHKERQNLSAELGNLSPEQAAAWGSEEMLTFELAIRQQFLSICSHHVQQITGKRALSVAEVIEQHLHAQGQAGAA